MDALQMINRGHPAIAACEELGIHNFKSARVDLLKRGDCGTSVYRLQDEVARTAPIIAKQCPVATGEVEQRVYEDILGNLDVAVAPYLGCLSAKEEGSCWIFLGEVEGEKYSPRNLEHRRVAGSWFAALHSALRSTEEPSDFPQRGSAHYQQLLTGTYERLTHARFDVGCGQHQRGILEALRRQLDRMSTGWSAIEEVCEAMPRTLVHGDLVTHNAYVRQEAAGPSFIPIDWEKAGWGTPAEDLSEIDLDTYWPAMTSMSARTGREHYVQLARVGRKFRCLVFLEWALPDTGTPVNQRVASLLEQCRSWLDELG
jgi:aminoglycoside phosphotransferase (APT) family kinase protein